MNNDPYFFIVSTNKPGRAAIVGVCCADWVGGNPATPAQNTAIKARVIENCTPSLRDALLEGNYSNGNMSRVFETRAAARQAAKELNDAPGFFKWSVVQMGKTERNLRRKVRGWQVVYEGSYVSCCNPKQVTALQEGASEDGCPSGAVYRYFLTRAAARAKMPKEEGASYRIRPLYA